MDLHDRTDDLVVIKQQRECRADRMAGQQQQPAHQQARHADPQREADDKHDAAELDAGGNRQRQTEQAGPHQDGLRSEEHTSELQSLMRISYAVFCLKKKNTIFTYTSLSFFYIYLLRFSHLYIIF